MATVETFFDRYLPALELEMRDVLRAHDVGQDNLFGLLRYHLGWVNASFRPCEAQSGKRMRPVVCLLACEGCGGAWEQALPAAAAIELLHNFTLIHDDLEDRDEKRRGRPTVWSIWGEAQGINAGDTLFALAQLAMTRLEERDLSSATVVQAMRLFNTTCVTLTRGQHLDIGFESRHNVSVKEYLAMVEGKTAALVASACEIGALVAGAPDGVRQSMRAFGRHLGLGFQMVDDILGVWGDSAVTGKPVGSDIVRGKKTLPVLHGLERSDKVRSLLAQQTLSKMDVREATDLLEQAGSRAYTERLAREHHLLALSALEEANLRETAAEVLRQLAHKLLNRRW